MAKIVDDPTSPAQPDAVPLEDGARPQRPEALGATRRDKTGTIAVCLALIVVAGYIYYESFGYREATGGDVGSAAMPRMVAAAGIVVAVLLIIRTLRLPTLQSRTTSNHLATVRVGIVVVVVALSAVALPLFGYTITMTALMLATGYLAGSRTWWANLLVAGVTTWASLLLFSRVFMVPLPLGALDRLLGG